MKKKTNTPAPISDIKVRIDKMKSSKNPMSVRFAEMMEKIMNAKK